MDSQNTTSREIPHDQRCVQLNLSGQPCGLKAVAGHDRCYIHGIFRDLNDGRSSIDIPLLEDEQSILFVFSQVARALAQGSMPAANANGIIGCCNGAQKLLAEKRKHERFAQKAAERRARGSTNGGSHPEPDEGDATVPANFKHAERAENADGAGTECVASAANLDTPSAPHIPEASDEPSDLQAVSSGENDSADHQAGEPQPWTLEPDRKIIPPPQFADARKKFDDTLARNEGDLTMALIQRSREIGARGGQGRDGVICNIRDRY